MKQIIISCLALVISQLVQAQSIGDLIIIEINDFRAEQGLAKLGESQCLTQAAQYHAAWMAAAQTGGHIETRPAGRIPALAEPGHRFAKYGCNGFGENVLKWYPAGETSAQTAKAVVQAWKDSPLHRELMLCPQMDGQVMIGVGIASWADGSGASYCLTFGLK
jgi:uncharacterized protein YkwD